MMIKIHLLITIVFIILKIHLLDCREQNNSKYELKFQTQVDNSTIIKSLNQQQIFKCQVKLSAPKRKSSYNDNKQLLSNVLLTIDWFKNNHNLTSIFIDILNNSKEAELPDKALISIINVELTKSNNSGLINHDKKTNKSVGKRIEIKNTLNVSQLKLASRIKLNHLNISDSGQYKCVARASYGLKALDNINIGDAEQEKQSEDSYQKSLIIEQQTIESNEATLLVNNSTGKYKLK